MDRCLLCSRIIWPALISNVRLDRALVALRIDSNESIDAINWFRSRLDAAWGTIRIEKYTVSADIAHRHASGLCVNCRVDNALAMGAPVKPVG